MRFVVAQRPLRRILWWIQHALFAGATVLLAYCAFVLLDAWVFQREERLLLESLLRNRPAADSGVRPTARPAPVGNGDLIGSIDIPRLGLSAIVVEGLDRKTLRRAVGHIPGTGLPGQAGNVGIAGHRDTFFRPLRNIQRDDIIALTTAAGEYRYRVVSAKVVSPDDVAVLYPGADEILTLVTCYPFYFVGSAPDRFIVRAERVT